MVDTSVFVPNGLRLAVVDRQGWRNGPPLSTRSGDDDYDCCQLAVIIGTFIDIIHCSYVDSAAVAGWS